MRAASVLAALKIDPLAYLRTEDPMEVMALGSIAQGANKFLNDRDSALAKAIAHEVLKGLGKMMKGKRSKK